jgi:aminoglycoside phosphotransferase (APT) family kinase protein
VSDALAGLLRKLDPVVAVAPLSHRGQSPAFRLELASGPAWKARVFPSLAAARRVERLLRARSAVDLPRPRWRLGPVLVTEFIEGLPVDRVIAASPGAEPALVFAAGALLGRLHAGRRPSGRALPVAFFRAALRRVVALLRRRGSIEAREAERLHALPPPGRSASVLTHGDLCPENLILATDRRLRAIDEERVALRPLGFELARTIARWPLDETLEEQLLAGYGQAGGDARSFVAARSFWLASAFATSVGYRLRVAPEAVGPALEALRRLARAQG